MLCCHRGGTVHSEWPWPGKAMVAGSGGSAELVAALTRAVAPGTG